MKLIHKDGTVYNANECILWEESFDNPSNLDIKNFLTQSLSQNPKELKFCNHFNQPLHFRVSHEYKQQFSTYPINI